jgi:hypothetical protein
VGFTLSHRAIQLQPILAFSHSLSFDHRRRPDTLRVAMAIGSARHGYEFVAPLDANGHIDPQENDESGYRFGVHAFSQGEYVSIRDENGELHTFRVVSVESIA